MGQGRPKVLIIGGGFGGLFCARRLGRSGGRRHAARPRGVPCVPAPALPMRDRDAEHRPDQPVAARGIGAPPQRHDAARRSRPARRRRAPRHGAPSRRDDVRSRLRLPGDRRGHAAVVLRQGGVRRLGARYEDPRRRSEHPAPGVRGFRDRRDPAAGARARPVAHLRRHRSGSDRCRIGRPDSGNWRPARWPTSSTASRPRRRGCCSSTAGSGCSRASRPRSPSGRSARWRSWAWRCTSACTSPTSGATA